LNWKWRREYNNGHIVDKYDIRCQINVLSKNLVEIVSGIPGTGKTRFTDTLFRNNPNLKKIYLPLSHEQADEREDFLTGINITHWEGVQRICPLVKKEPIKTWFEIGAPTRWICRLCQSKKLKLIKASDCPHKQQFKNPENTVIAPVAYTFTQHIEKYNPDIVVVDDIILQKKDLTTRKEMENYVLLLYQSGFCDYKTLEELFDQEEKELKRYILNTIEPKLKKGIKRNLEVTNIHSKEVSRYFLKIDPMTLLDWYRLVKVYGWQEEFSIPLLMPVFELALKEGRRVIIVGAQMNKAFLEMEVRCFQREYGYPITLQYRKMKFDSLPNSVVYRVRSPKYDNAWYPTTTSIVKSKITRNSVKQRIEIILFDQEKSIEDLTVGIIKPKNAPLKDFLTTLVEHKCRVLSLNFGNLRGSNKLEHCDLLIIVGTYNVNIESLQKDFIRFFHRKPWSVISVKQFDGGYQYVDPDLENFRLMVEEYEMYQAIHRIRPGLQRKKIYVFGLIPKEIKKEFEVKNLSFEKDLAGGINLIEWKDFEEFMEQQIGDGIYMTELVKLVVDEVGIAKQNAYERIHKFVRQHNDKYEIIDKKIGKMVLKYVQRRR